MSAKVTSIGLKGLEGYAVQVEVQVVEGMESIVVVGLPDASVKESKERVSAALRSLGFSLVDMKVIINLSPAEQKKNGPLFDLAIAIGVLKSADFLKDDVPKNAGFIGALSLDGTVLPVEGMIAAILAAKKLKLRTLFLPFDPSIPSIDIPGLELVYIETIRDVLDVLSGQQLLPFPRIEERREEQQTIDRDFNQIIGHEFAKRAMEIAASGEHFLLMDGPPGCGKSLLAETFRSILPPLSKEAQLEKISLYQLAGAPYTSITLPPYRHPHHSASAVSIIGGGTNPKPGEVSLAHRGVLFLDELGEFSKKTLDMLRQPLENETVTISRAHSTVTYPAKFIFIAAMNPCPCGYYGSKDQYCTCSEKQIKAYKSRVSGPILDRMDLLLSLKAVNLKNHDFAGIESSREIMKRVRQARERQHYRYGREICNGSVPFEELIKKSPLTPEQQKDLQQLSIHYGLSNRVQIKIIRLARTISDLVGEETITDGAITEALTFRKLSRTSTVSLTGEDSGMMYN
ncbi:magnesium chelatase [[Bacillus] enclensis]|uniref:Magnesium chelatase family protein n=1 Tax=[Bacillus] enclensis TaxID=1402860 RepID=A0A0V8HCY1_9BACI|nr:YifB family Mg chelatase-like AAA ATPase [[Bacillus] enclensis]KSU60390.1 magnesium chelatase [[Bacillus] enclensis]SCC23968.1 magnesium chelatase family protein [[Bacillus] enclensis]